MLLWITGVALVYNKWGGFAILPWQFHAKLTAVVLLTVTMGCVHRLQALIRKGDGAAVAQIAPHSRAKAPTVEHPSARSR